MTEGEEEVDVKDGCGGWQLVQVMVVELVTTRYTALAKNWLYSLHSCWSGV